jgi:hypothetical protein
VEYRVLSDEEVLGTVLSPAPQKYIFAVDDNKVVCLATLYFGKQYQFCNSCTGHCAQGNIVWTHPDYRNQGVLRSMFSWGTETLGVEKVYAGMYDGLDAPVEAAAIHWKEGLLLPPGTAYDGPTVYANGEKTAIWVVEAISDRLGYDF